ncbi:MAG: hypothetical protein AB7K09_03380 [Planctomycetota bacterium]
MRTLRLLTVPALLLLLLPLALPALHPTAAQDGDPGSGQPALPKEANLRWSFRQGQTLHFVFTTSHASITSMKGTAKGAVLRLVYAMAEADEKTATEAAELLKKGGKPVLEILEEFVDKVAKAKERKMLEPIITHLKANPEAQQAMPDRLVVADRQGNTQCAVDWAVEKTRGPRSTVHVKTQHISVHAKQRTLGMDDYEHASFTQGQTTIDPRTGQSVVVEEPDNPLAAMFFHAMSLDYRFTVDVNQREVVAFSYTNESAEAERKAMNLTDPLQIGPSFRRLPGEVRKLGDTWEVSFEYDDAANGTRVHVCSYTLKEIAMRQQRRCARIPWVERIYMRAPRAPFPGKPCGGGEGEFWIDIDEGALAFHSQEIAYESATVLKVPERGSIDNKMIEMETWYNNVLKIELRLSRITNDNSDE